MSVSLFYGSLLVLPGKVTFMCRFYNKKIAFYLAKVIDKSHGVFLFVSA